VAGNERVHTVRSYRGVIDEVERRIFRLDRWRLPTPHGVSVRAVGYVACCLLAVLLASGLPLVGSVLGLLPDSLRLVVLPVLGGWAMASLRIDGRPPHRACAAVLRYRLSPRTLAGLRPCPRVGDRLAPVEMVQIAPSGDEPRLRPGRVRGPSWIGLRYPVRVEVEGARGTGSDRPRRRLANAHRVRVISRPERARALQVVRTLRVPAGREIEFR
jgi:hypothetical protein